MLTISACRPPNKVISPTSGEKSKVVRELRMTKFDFELNGLDLNFRISDGVEMKTI